MTIQIVAHLLQSNQYIDLLALHYKKKGAVIIGSPDNFYSSNFVPDVLHIHWPEAIYRGRFQLPQNTASIKKMETRLSWYKKHKTIIVHTIHNFIPHETDTPEFDKKMYNLFIGMSDILVHHGVSSKELICKHYPVAREKKNIVCPHGPYEYKNISKKEARIKFNIPENKFVILNIGRQRKNKGEEFVNTVFSNLSLQKKHLFTIGHKDIPRKKFLQRRIDAIQSKIKKPNPHKTIQYRNFANSEIPYILHASDLLLLGNQSGLTSGVLALAATYSKPIVFPDIGNFKEQLQGYSAWASYQKGNVKNAIAAIQHLKNKDENQDLILDNTEWLQINSWEYHVSAIFETINKI